VSDLSELFEQLADGPSSLPTPPRPTPITTMALLHFTARLDKEGTMSVPLIT
jgi:hypothetical protein